MIFKDIVQFDNSKVFLNNEEFADIHDLNGYTAKAVVQDISTSDTLSTGNTRQYENVLYGANVTVNCEKSVFANVEDIPESGMLFSLDGKSYTVDSVADDMGMLTIVLIANDR